MSLFEIFIVFFKIGFFTIGGGYAMLPLIQKEVVETNDWLSEEEFLDATAIAQTAPGALAINISVYIGYKLKGVLGAIVCTIGSALPSLIIMIVVAKFLYKYKELELVSKAFMGIRPAVVALILSVAYTIGKVLKLKKDVVILVLSSFFLIVFLKVNPAIVIILGAIFSANYYNEQKDN